MTTLRRANVEDLPAVLRMAAAFITSGAYRDVLALNTGCLEALFLQLLDCGVVFLAEVDGQAVGMLAASVGTHPISGEPVAGEVCWWVEPDYRGSVAAVRLLIAAQAWARDERGAASFQLIAPAGSELGEFYERLGYREMETTYQLRLRA